MERNWKNYVIHSHMPRDKSRLLLKQDSNSTLFSKEVIGKFICSCPWFIWYIRTTLHISVSLVMDFCHWWVEIGLKSAFKVNCLCQESFESFWIPLALFDNFFSTKNKVRFWAKILSTSSKSLTLNLHEYWLILHLQETFNHPDDITFHFCSGSRLDTGQKLLLQDWTTVLYWRHQKKISNGTCVFDKEHIFSWHCCTHQYYGSSGMHCQLWSLCFCYWRFVCNLGISFWGHSRFDFFSMFFKWRSDDFQRIQIFNFLRPHCSIY